MMFINRASMYNKLTVVQ